MASGRRPLSAVSGFCRSIAIVLLLSVTQRTYLSSGKSWSETISNAIKHDQTKTGVVEPGETVSIVNTSGRDLVYLPPDNKQVYNVASDVCQVTIPTLLSTLFATSDDIEWVVTGNTRTLIIPSDVVPPNVTVQFCFQVMDTEKNKRLTAVIKVAGAKGLSTKLCLFLGLPLLVVVTAFVS
uniref:SAG-related sequence SRS35B n=1 Tax=Toxoplasma gondii COUG TaxID=1074873 RepID=A0A2G8Y5E0_TOXGO|nr:SAG-related sequence SRS35B [Toxoplasma gondii COUG]